jgi:hypothetical protein
MNKYTLIILTLLILLPIATADTNITIQIYEDSSGDYFISVNDEGLEECQGSTCNITIENSTMSKYSDSEIKDIARYISLELDIPDNTDFNTTEMHALFKTVSEEKQMNDRAWIRETWMPTTMEYQNCTLELEQVKGALATLDARLGGHDREVKALEDNLENTAKTRDLYLGFDIIMGVAIAILILYINGVFDVLLKNKRRR